MYAVVKTGGKQYRVEKEDVVLVEKLCITIIRNNLHFTKITEIKISL